MDKILILSILTFCMASGWGRQREPGVKRHSVLGNVFYNIKLLVE